MKNYKLIIFDWDGTLFDSGSYIVRYFQQTALELGLERVVEEVIRNSIGINLDNVLERKKLIHLFVHFVIKWKTMLKDVIKRLQTIIKQTRIKQLKWEAERSLLQILWFCGAVYYLHSAP